MKSLLKVKKRYFHLSTQFCRLLLGRTTKNSIKKNNLDFHWSLLVYEIKSKKFYYYDTLKGANYHYIQPSVKIYCNKF